MGGRGQGPCAGSIPVIFISYSRNDASGERRHSSKITFNGIEPYGVETHWLVCES